MKKTAHRTQSPFKVAAKPLLVIISGPSGVGKDAVLARMRELGYPARCVTTVTTRPRRPNERDNVDYRFVSMDRFQEMMENGELLEWAQVYGNWYGVPKKEVKEALDRGEDVMVKVDVQGAATIKKALPQAIFIFLMPPSTEELLTRLRQRHTESASDLALRLETADDEIRQLPMYDYVVVNRWDEIDLAVADIQAIITGEKCRVTPREVTL